VQFRGHFERVLLPGMVLPEPLGMLFDWIEERDLVFERNGIAVGTLFSAEEINEGWTDTERPGGTYVEFFPEGNKNLHYWFGVDDPAVIDRVSVIGKSGADGSMIGLWLDGDATHIVHMGSGSGSGLVCVLGDEAVDFLRLLAIGYDEICWSEEYDKTIEEAFETAGLVVHPNEAYRTWVTSTFGVTIPKRAIELVKHPAEMSDDDPLDAFGRWVAGKD
jgi:hypothetical protein